MDLQNFNAIKSHAIKSVKWTGLSEIVSRSIQPIVTLILARLLTPADFGIVGVAMIAIGLGQIFQDIGLGKTLIQRETEVEKSANIIFWTNLSLSVFIYLILFLSAPLFSIFFHEPKVVDVLRVLCLQIVLFSFISVHQALFQRNFQFKQLFFIRLFSAIIPGLVSIPLALAGHGVWALVYGTLAGAFVQVLLFWKASTWRPSLNYDTNLARKLFSFGSLVTLEMLLWWGIMWGDHTVVGYFLGIEQLGIYRIGVTFVTLAFGLFFNPLLPVAYSSFSRLQNNSEDLRRYFLRLTQLIMMVSLPIAFSLLVLGKPMSTILFGQKWEGVEIVISIFGLSHGLAWCFIGLNFELYRAIGRPDLNLKISAVTAFVYILAYLLAAPHGLLIFCLSRLLLVILSIFPHMFIISKQLSLKFIYKEVWNLVKFPLIASILMAFYLFVINNSNGLFKNWLIIIFIIATGTLVYFVSLWVINKKDVQSLFKVVKDGIAG